MHVKFQFLTNGLDVFETLLVVGSCTTDPDLDFMFNKSAGNFTEGANDPFEG